MESNSKVTSDSLVAYVMSLIFKGNVRFLRISRCLIGERRALDQMLFPVYFHQHKQPTISMIFESVPVLPPLNITLPLRVIPLPVRVDLIRETVMIHDDSYKMSAFNPICHPRLITDFP